MQLVLISLFGVLGVLSRYGLDKIVATPENSFPWNTFFVNILGCAIAGTISVFAEKELMNSSLQVALLVGFCGGFTTFSAYALQTISMFEKNKAMPALIYFLLSPTLGLAAVFAAILFTRKLIGTV